METLTTKTKTSSPIKIDKEIDKEIDKKMDKLINSIIDDIDNTKNYSKYYFNIITRIEKSNNWRKDLELLLKLGEEEISGPVEIVNQENERMPKMKVIAKKLLPLNNYEIQHIIPIIKNLFGFNKSNYQHASAKKKSKKKRKQKKGNTKKKKKFSKLK